MRGLLDGAFYGSTTEFLNRKRPIFDASRPGFSERIGEWIGSSGADSVISSVIPPPGFESRHPGIAWVHLVLRPRKANHFAGLIHHDEAIVKAGLDLMTRMLQRAEVGLPEHPLVVRVPGVWSDRNLVVRPKSAKAGGLLNAFG
jgi:hypothetical protein